MDYKKLIIRGISYSQSQSGAYALLLEHEDTGIKIPVVIGNFEAQSISIGLEKDLRPPRPLTHDLFASFMKKVGYQVVSVIIYKIIDGVFFSNINMNHTVTGEEIVMDARTSDAVAMAVRFDASIYTTAEVLNEAGIMLEIEENASKSKEDEEERYDLEDSLEHYSTEELETLLKQAVNEEDFDTALEIQEELKRRKKKID